MLITIVVIAIAVAVVAALCLAVGTHLQHRAVRGSGAADRDRPGAGVARALTQPVWILGAGLIVLATVLNVAALGLAPVALVQPVGCLSLVAAVVISARSLGIPVRRGLVIGISLTIASVAVFVGVSAGFAQETRATETTVSLLSWLLLCLSLLGLLVAHGRTGHLARVACAGILFGAVASAVHVVAVEVLAAIRTGAAGAVAIGATAAPTPRLWALAGLTAVAVAIGAWLVQTAYASGPPETVLAGLTVVDPLVAIAIGAILLGEYAAIPPLGMLVLALCGASAFVGIATVVRHHPELAATRPDRSRARPADARPADAQRAGTPHTDTPRAAVRVLDPVGADGVATRNRRS